MGRCFLTNQKGNTGSANNGTAQNIMKQNRIITKKSLASLPEGQRIAIRSTNGPFYGKIISPAGYIQDVAAKINILSDKGEEKTIGVFRAKLVDLWTADGDQVRSLDVLGSKTETANYIECLLDKENDAVKKSITDLLSNRFCWHIELIANILFIDHLAIDPDYRGKKIALAVLETIMRHFGGGHGCNNVIPIAICESRQY